jgi:hypothetical protein
MYPLLRGVPSLRCVEIACRGNEIRLARCVWVSVCERVWGGRGEDDPIGRSIGRMASTTFHHPHNHHPTNASTSIHPRTHIHDALRPD